jgi:hypothetical protein
VRLKKVSQKQAAKKQKYLLSHQHPRRKQLLRRVNALLRFQSQFFKQRKQLMLLQRRHVAPKLRAVMRKLLQKIPHQRPVRPAQPVMTVIQIHAAVIVAVAAEDADVVAHKVKVLKAPMQIRRKIPQKIQKMVLRANPQMAPHIAVAVAVVQQAKMSLQEKQLMKMAS